MDKHISSEWTVLLIGGSSSVGKTTLAKQIGLYFGVPWLQVDDLRLALQNSSVLLPNHTEALYFFTSEEVWELPPARLCDGLTAVGEVLSPAIEIVIANHVETKAAIVIEGDGILPALLTRPEVHKRSTQVRAVFLLEPDEEVILANIVARGRGVKGRTEVKLHTEARTKWLYGQWLREEAHRYNLPVVESRPWSTLFERIISVIQA
jgi:2-phosphoglycerate kinase